MAIPITEKLIQRQINHWHSFRKYLKNNTEEGPPTPGLIITVSREAGAGGRALAENLAASLGLPLHDRSLVNAVVRQENLPPALVAELDERITSQTDLWIKGIFNRRIFLLREYQQALTATITRLADTVGGVFLGRGAHLVLGERADLRLRIVAGRQVRLNRLQERESLGYTEAEALLQETDQGRTEFLTKVFGVRKCPACDFDLTINTDHITPDDQLQLSLLSLVTRAERQGDFNSHSQVKI